MRFEFRIFFRYIRLKLPCFKFINKWRFQPVPIFYHAPFAQFGHIKYNGAPMLALFYNGNAVLAKLDGLHAPLGAGVIGYTLYAGLHYFFVSAAILYIVWYFYMAPAERFSVK